MSIAGGLFRDAVCLRTDAIKNGNLFIYTQKTGTPVKIPLAPTVIKNLNDVAVNPTYFFWLGNGLKKSAVNDWQRSLAILFKLAGVKAKAHMFRSRFPIRLLQKGLSVENVAARSAAVILRFDGLRGLVLLEVMWTLNSEVLVGDIADHESQISG